MHSLIVKVVDVDGNERYLSSRSWRVEEPEFSSSKEDAHSFPEDEAKRAASHLTQRDDIPGTGALGTLGPPPSEIPDPDEVT